MSSDEAVEAAAKALREAPFSGVASWGDIAQTALDAAAPYMLKTAYDLGFSHGRRGTTQPVQEPVVNISDEAVEAAAHGLALQAWGDWEYVPDELRRLFLRDARTALEAAAPHLK